MPRRSRSTSRITIWSAFMRPCARRQRRLLVLLSPAQRSPVQEGTVKADAAVRLEVAIAVRNRNSHAVAINAGLCGEISVAVYEISGVR